MWRAQQNYLRNEPLGVASQHNTLAVCRVASIQVDCYRCCGFFPKCLLGSSAIFMMADNEEQRACVKFCFLLGKCFQQWEKRWYKCIELKGEYFEEDQSCNSIKPNRPLKKIIPVIFGYPHVCKNTQLNYTRKVWC